MWDGVKAIFRQRVCQSVTTFRIPGACWKVNALPLPTATGLCRSVKFPQLRGMPESPSNDGRQNIKSFLAENIT